MPESDDDDDGVPEPQHVLVACRHCFNLTKHYKKKKSSSENVEAVKIERKISQIEIKVNDEKALLPLRTVLSQKISNNSEDAKIILIANRDNQEIKIALASNFKIAEIDIFRLKNLHKDLIIKSIN